MHFIPLGFRRWISRESSGASVAVTVCDSRNTVNPLAVSAQRHNRDSSASVKTNMKKRMKESYGYG
jgi:hypothetical protein